MFALRSFCLFQVIRKRLLHFVATACPHHMAIVCAFNSSGHSALCAVRLSTWILCACAIQIWFLIIFFFFVVVENGVHIFIGSFARWPVSIVASFSWVSAVRT